MGSRILSKMEFFNVLQEEYLIADIKKRIYFSPADKRYYEKVMEGKRTKIIDLSEKLKSGNIFNDKAIEKKFKDKLLPSKGLPQFQMSGDDLRNYFAPEAIVKIWISEQEQLPGSIVSADLERNILRVKLRGEKDERVVSVHHVNRVVW